MQKLAEKWDVEIHADAWTSTRYENARYIYPAAQLKLLREIRAARRERIRWFFQIVVTPLIALLGLLVALVSLLTRK